MATTTPTPSNLITFHTHLHALLLSLSLKLHLTSLSPFPPLNSNRLSTYNYKNNPNDPLEVLYTLSPPAFHYLPRSTLLPPQVVRKGFMETPENCPPLLEGGRMQIMVIPKGVRRVVIHFLVYEPVRRGSGDKSGGNSQRSRFAHDKLDTGDGTPYSSNPNSNSKKNSTPTKNKLRKKDSVNKFNAGGGSGNNKHNRSPKTPKSKSRDQITTYRSSARVSRDSRRNSAFDDLEIEELREDMSEGMSEYREEKQREGDYVVMRRVVKLPRKVWCGRNCRDTFEQLFIRRT